MRTFDLTPFYRSTIGFDRLFNLLDQSSGDNAAPGYPRSEEHTSELQSH